MPKKAKPRAVARSRKPRRVRPGDFVLVRSYGLPWYGRREHGRLVGSDGTRDAWPDKPRHETAWGRVESVSGGTAVVAARIAGHPAWAAVRLDLHDDELRRSPPPEEPAADKLDGFRQLQLWGN